MDQSPKDRWLMSFHLWLIAKDATERATALVEAGSELPLPDATVAVVMAAASTEAFINEFVELISASNIKGPSRSLVNAMAELEAERAPTTLKYLVASLVLSGEMFDRGKKPFQDLSDLMRLRNGIMHLNPTRPSRVVERFRTTQAQPSGEETHWLHELQTEKVSLWACDSAYAIVRATLEMFPEWPYWSHLPPFKDYWNLSS